MNDRKSIGGSASDGSISNGTTWRTLRIGAGGWLTGIDISPAGETKVVRTDTYGAYVWDESQSSWRQLVTADSMPADDIDLDHNSGVYEIRVAPSAPSRMYMAYRGHIYRTDNGGSKWTRTAFARVDMDPNDDFRMFGQKMAVDPANPDVAYVGTPRDGTFVTYDGGATWQAISAIPKGLPSPKGGTPGITGIAFDPSSAIARGKTGIIYVSSYGNGVYQSTDSGTSWGHLAGGPTSISHGKIGRDGAFYATAGDASSVWRFLSGNWTNIAPTKDFWGTVVPDPFDASRVIAIRGGGYLDISNNRGASWSGIIWGPNGQNNRVATDVPWLSWTNEKYMAEGDMMFDPMVRSRLWFAEGIGVWYADLPVAAGPPASVTFVSHSAGIEQLVANQVLAPPGGKPVVASWDRPVFYVDNPDVYPSSHGPDNQHQIVMGWAIDYASKAPNFIAGIFNWWGLEKSGYSTNGGQSWISFASYPPTVVNGKIGGSVAASTPANIVWAPSNNSPAYYSRDGGVTWLPVVVDGVPSTGETGWGWAYYLKRRIVAADRVTLGTFYLYNYLKGLYRSTDGGASWELVHSGEIAPSSSFNAQLQSVPERAGQLFFTSGAQGNPGDRHPAPGAFMRSIDGGATWTAVPNVLEVRAFGFGKGSTDYPAIYIVGWVRGAYGVWRSDDNARTWMRIGVFPLGSLDSVVTIDGDKNVHGTAYIGFNGSGYAYAIQRAGPGAQ
jgi:hypothetical protein